MISTFLRFALMSLFAVAPHLATAQPKPDAVTPDGGRYFGPLVDGKLHGRGRLEWPNGSIYEGDFKDGQAAGEGRIVFGNGNRYEGQFAGGMMAGRGRFEVPGREVYEGEMRQDWYWGSGEVRYAEGRSYRGEFVMSEPQGRGRLELANGDVYEGEFHKGDFVRGTMTRKDGARYEGEFRNWTFHGPGRYTDVSGSVWEGVFAEGQLQGNGKFTSLQGTYEGGFKGWAFHGHGILRLQNGDVYEGGFEDGVYSGEGTLTYAKPRRGRTQDKGLWRYGYLPNEAEEALALALPETALYAQKPLLDKVLAKLKPREAGRINLYFLGVAGDGSQEVFRREVEYVGKDFGTRFGTAGRSVLLINSRNTATTAPMATLTSIRQAVKSIAARMNTQQDILFLFLTSHGSQQQELTLSVPGMRLAGLKANDLAAILKEAGIRWKVVVVSACYSGGFLEALRDEHSLVMSAARHDRRSFGCSDENDFTYFGRAFFKEALPASKSFQEAFEKAQALVGEWEIKDARDAAGPGESDPEASRSLPQIATTPLIDGHLRRWRAQRRP